MGEVHTSLCKMSNDVFVDLWELINGNLTCLPIGQKWLIDEFKFGILLHWIYSSFLRESITDAHGWP
jgi:hypothetical protein